MLTLVLLNLIASVWAGVVCDDFTHGDCKIPKGTEVVKLYNYKGVPDTCYDDKCQELCSYAEQFGEGCCMWGIITKDMGLKGVTIKDLAWMVTDQGNHASSSREQNTIQTSTCSKQRTTDEFVKIRASGSIAQSTVTVTAWVELIRSAKTTSACPVRSVSSAAWESTTRVATAAMTTSEAGHIGNHADAVKSLKLQCSLLWKAHQSVLKT